MSLRLLILIICTSFGNAYGQVSNRADDLFQNFEYSNALNAYLEIGKQKELSYDEKLNLAFCYYILGEYKNGVPFISSIITNYKDDKSPHLWLWKGTLEKESGDFQNAKKSLTTFLSLTKQLNEEVNVMIESCSLLESLDSLDRHVANPSQENHMLLNSYSSFSGGVIKLMELGVDKDLKVQDPMNVAFENAVFFVTRPVEGDSNSLREMRLFEKFPYLSINRIQFLKGTNTIYFSAIDLLNKNDVLRAQQIYSAEFTSFSEPINKYNLWEYSGIIDTSSCSHPAISNNGSKMVFAKSSKSTRGSDLYVSNYSNGKWSQPEELSSFNTFGNEMFPTYHGDSLLTFSTDGRPGYGGLDVFGSKIQQEEFESNFLHYGFPYNSSMDDYNLTWSDSLNGMIVSNRIGGKGDDDVWNIMIEPILLPTPTPIPVPVPDGFDEWYSEWNLKPIYYDFDSFESEANNSFIDGCIKYREKYGVELKLIGHTDSRGSDGYNFELGAKRALNLKEQLIKANVQNVIETESKGEKALAVECGDGKECTNEEHQLNRFVLIEVSKRTTNVE